VIDLTTPIVSFDRETFIVHRREAVCLRARAFARLRRSDEAAVNAQRCIDWQVAASSPEIDEMRRLMLPDNLF